MASGNRYGGTSCGTAAAPPSDKTHEREQAWRRDVCQNAQVDKMFATKDATVLAWQAQE